MEILLSNSQLMLEKSLGFLWTKQAALLDNIANAETPNYKGKVVSFEESLRAELEQAAGQRSGAGRAVRQVIEDSEWYVTEPQEAVRMDENSVNTTEQMVEIVRNSYQMQYVMQSISSNLSLILTAVKGQ